MTFARESAVIDKEREAQILRLFHVEKWKIGTIAAELGHHHSTVERVLLRAGSARTELLAVRPSIADAYVPLIVETLAKHPRLRASRIWVMAKERGYAGSQAHFRSVVARHRPRPTAEAFLRLRTLPGEQAQVDWGHFGKISVGAATRTLSGFVMVLSYSRQIFLRFSFDARMPSFLRGHVEAFHFFGGVPRTLLYDNLKSAVLERVGDAIRFHPTLLELAAHYRFSPRPCAPARGNEKGRVERAIRYIRDSFFAARPYRDLDDLNAQALEWMTGTAADRPCPEDRARSVRAVFEAERDKLFALPGDPFPTDDREDVDVGKTPYVRFDLNDYSVPHTHVRRTLVVVASPDTVRVLDGNDVIATHPRSYDRGAQVEDPRHVEALVLHKQGARELRALDRLHHAAPRVRDLLALVAERGGNLGNLVHNLTRLLDVALPEDLEAAIAEAIDRGTPHLGAIRALVDQRRHARGEPPPVTLHAPRDPRHARVVRPHLLSTYDQLAKEPDDEET